MQEVNPEVTKLLNAVSDFTEDFLVSQKLELKIQIEQDFRGKPVLSVRVREQGVKTELMPSLRYPE